MYLEFFLFQSVLTTPTKARRSSDCCGQAAKGTICFPMTAHTNAEPLQIKSACDVCGSYAVRELYTASDRLRNDGQVWKIAECKGCGVFRTLPELSDDELSRYYPNEYWGAPEPSQEWV